MNRALGQVLQCNGCPSCTVTGVMHSGLASMHYMQMVYGEAMTAVDIVDF